MKTKKIFYLFTIIILFVSCIKPQFKGTIYCRIVNGDGVKTDYEYYKIFQDTVDLKVKMSKINIDPEFKTYIDTNYFNYIYDNSEKIIFNSDNKTKLYDFKNNKAIILLPFSLVNGYVNANQRRFIKEYELSPDGSKLAYIKQNAIFIASLYGKSIKIIQADSGSYGNSIVGGLDAYYIWSELQMKWMDNNKLLIGYHSGELPRRLNDYKIHANLIGLVVIDESMNFKTYILDTATIQVPFEINHAYKDNFSIEVYKWIDNSRGGIELSDSATFIYNTSMIDNKIVVHKQKIFPGIILPDKDVLTISFGESTDDYDIIITKLFSPPDYTEKCSQQIKTNGFDYILNPEGSQMAYFKNKSNDNNQPINEYYLNIVDLKTGRLRHLFSDIKSFNYHYKIYQTLDTESAKKLKKTNFELLFWTK